MVTCEFFESNFQAWKKGELPQNIAEALHSHSLTCESCRSYSLKTAAMKKILADLPQYSPAPGFEFRLKNRFKEDSSGQKRAREGAFSIIPRWAALGAGITTGVAVGLVLMLAPHQLGENNTGFAEAPSNVLASDERINASGDSLEKNSDSLTIPADLYDSDQHSRIVSGER